MSNEYIFFTDQTALTFRICLVYCIAQGNCRAFKVLIRLDNLYGHPARSPVLISSCLGHAWATKLQFVTFQNTLSKKTNVVLEIVGVFSVSEQSVTVENVRKCASIIALLLGS